MLRRLPAQECCVLRRRLAWHPISSLRAWFRNSARCVGSAWMPNPFHGNPLFSKKNPGRIAGAGVQFPQRGRGVPTKWALWLHLRWCHSASKLLPFGERNTRRAVGETTTFDFIFRMAKFIKLPYFFHLNFARFSSSKHHSSRPYERVRQDPPSSR